MSDDDRTRSAAGKAANAWADLVDRLGELLLVAEGAGDWPTDVTIRRRRRGRYELHTCEHGDGATAVIPTTSQLDRDGLLRHLERLCAERSVRRVGE
jgi:hypothetical protein